MIVKRLWRYTQYGLMVVLFVSWACMCALAISEFWNILCLASLTYRPLLGSLIGFPVERTQNKETFMPRTLSFRWHRKPAIEFKAESAVPLLKNEAVEAEALLRIIWLLYFNGVSVVVVLRFSARTMKVTLSKYVVVLKAIKATLSKYGRIT